jgi:metallophosphoesterase superfamily enzyme
MSQPSASQNVKQGRLSCQERKTKRAEEFILPVIDAPPDHVHCNNWVVFSDLHVKSSSIDVCEKVLHEVHEAAKKRKAGIIFLGDFWHVRGALNVDLLNRVLSSLSKWSCPVIMIPGNHDQVALHLLQLSWSDRCDGVWFPTFSS